MKQPLCSNTNDGECPNFALNGIEVCLQHAPIARDNFGFTIDIGYRPGGIGIPSPPPVVDRPAVTVDWKDPAPPVRRRGWIAEIAAVFR
ncbi:hypothetical protein F9C11_21655 [Amycolatopsis sp. VS8301801F10]|uniref:hypothetical protein n=1 Tax=Amycolatopsis sp. VS8301801F10 TaxID=2652442 RepID=UPI0038FC210E